MHFFFLLAIFFFTFYQTRIWSFRVFVSIEDHEPETFLEEMEVSETAHLVTDASLAVNIINFVFIKISTYIKILLHLRVVRIEYYLCLHWNLRIQMKLVVHLQYIHCRWHYSSDSFSNLFQMAISAIWRPRNFIHFIFTSINGYNLDKF